MGLLAVGRYAHERSRRLGTGGPRLLPSDPGVLPRTDQWAAWAQIHLTPVMERLRLAGQILPDAERDVSDMRPALRQFRRGLALLKQSLPASSPFVNGVGFSLADITIGATLTLARLIPETTLRLARFPRTQAYLEGLEARASFAERPVRLDADVTPLPDRTTERSCEGDQITPCGQPRRRRARRSTARAAGATRRTRGIVGSAALTAAANASSSRSRP